ncbi:MAG TPA: tripartite tricarboxylate transporter substrate binding protein [Rubrivivax sp.]|nr:tripartite tricarboxylate transporter substrate binding protein [Rubrivivax sp.]
MSFTRRSTLRMLALPSLAGLVTPAVRGQGFPNRLLTIVVAWPAGNPLDAMARKLQPLIAKEIAQTVVIDNVSGAGGTIGVGRVMVQPADGHTIVMGSPTEMILSPATMPAARYRPEDFQMVAFFGRAPYVLVGRPSLPQRTLAEIGALRGKASAPPLSLGNIGPGSQIHLAALQFARASGVAVVHVPYKGVAPMLQDVMGGQIDLAFVPVNGNLMSFLNDGKLRSYGLASTEPYPLFPTLQTMASGSPDFSDFRFDTWGAMFVRSSTAADASAHLNRAINSAAQDAGFREWANATGTEIARPMSLAELDQLYRAEVKTFQRLAKSIPSTS